jgi:hypothetical protein
MDRRRFLLTSLAGALAAPLTTEAQPTSSVRRVGMLVPIAWDPNHPQVIAFQQRMRDLGYTDGRNVAYEARGDQGNSFQASQANWSSSTPTCSSPGVRLPLLHSSTGPA